MCRTVQVGSSNVGLEGLLLHLRKTIQQYTDLSNHLREHPVFNASAPPAHDDSHPFEDEHNSQMQEMTSLYERLQIVQEQIENERATELQPVNPLTSVNLNNVDMQGNIVLQRFLAPSVTLDERSRNPSMVVSKAGIENEPETPKISILDRVAFASVLNPTGRARRGAVCAVQGQIHAFVPKARRSSSRIAIPRSLYILAAKYA